MLPHCEVADQLPASGRWENENPPALVAYLRCSQCSARFYGVSLLRRPTCPACRQGELVQIGTWDLARQAWWPLLREVAP